MRDLFVEAKAGVEPDPVLAVEVEVEVPVGQYPASRYNYFKYSGTYIRNKNGLRARDNNSQKLSTTKTTRIGRRKRKSYTYVLLYPSIPSPTPAPTFRSTACTHCFSLLIPFLSLTTLHYLPLYNHFYTVPRLFPGSKNNSVPQTLRRSRYNANIVAWRGAFEQLIDGSAVILGVLVSVRRGAGGHNADNKRPIIPVHASMACNYQSIVLTIICSFVPSANISFWFRYICR